MARPQKIAPIHRIFESRRKFPRLVMNIPAIVTVMGGKRVKATLYDLSPDGVQIWYQMNNVISITPDNIASQADLNSLKCILQFRLSTMDNVQQVKINSRFIYVRPTLKNTLAAGILFDDGEVDTIIIKDFLLEQLEFSDTDFSSMKFNKAEMKPQKKTIKGKLKPDPVAKDTKTSVDVEKIAIAVEPARADMEYLKQELTRVMGSLKVIQETTRVIVEKMYNLEQKISRKN